MKTAFINASLLHGDKEFEIAKNQIIIIEDETIIKVGEDLDVNDCKIIDLKGKYLMPGLINMHVHLAGSGKPSKKKKDNAKLVKTVMSNPLTRMVVKNMCANFAKEELLSGVTTIRTVGGIKNFDSLIRDEINAGKRIGPRIFTSDEAISVKGGHMAGSVAIEVDTESEAIAYVAKAKERNSDLIKLMITGGVLDAEVKGEPGAMKMDPKIVKAACDKAHELNLKVAAHTESNEGVKVALRNGVDSIEHGAKPDEEMITLFKETGSYLVTTLSPAVPFNFFSKEVNNASEVDLYNGRLVFEGIRDCAIAALENGIPVGLGNDTACPFVTHYNFWRELYFFAKYCDVSNGFALATATKRNAELLGIDKQVGTIEEGKIADILIVEDNPLEDLRALSKVNYVVSRGHIIHNPEVKHIKEVDKQLDTLFN